jgi:hypothetical protein
MTNLDETLPPVFLQPAYGRTYATPKAALADWQAGKDFKIYTAYCSIRDLDSLKQISSSVWLDLVTQVIRIY